MLRLVLLGLALQRPAEAGAAYSLPPAEYDRLPARARVDAYAACLRAPGDAYCFVGAHLRGNRSHALYNTLLEYSESVLTHFNHTKVYRGICPKKSCGRYMKRSSNLTAVVEACLDAALRREHGLSARVFEALCERRGAGAGAGAGAGWDAGDAAYGAALLALLALNLLGSLYDFCTARGNDSFLGRLLLSFSVRRSWRRLAAPARAHPMQRRIRVIYSLRTITSLAVILGHSPIPGLIAGNDSRFIEEMYHHLVSYILFNGTLVVQIFFLMSGFLLAYNFLLSEEERPPTWRNLPMAVLLRWLRLMPSYAMVMFFVMTWARRAGRGPFFLKVVTSESLDCRRNWWRHLLFTQNYKDHSQCMAHGWYLAADFQLTVVGLVVFCALHSHRRRQAAVAALLALGVLAPAAHVLLQNVHPILVVSPEVALNFFVEDPTFNYMYKRGHTNLACYALGLATAYSVHGLKESDLGAHKYKKYRVLVWLAVPLMLLLMLACSAFYAAGPAPPPPPLAARAAAAAAAAAVRPVFGFLTIILLFFTVVKADSVGQQVLHWGGWARAARLTYGAYLLHVAVLRFNVGSSDELIPIGVYWIVQNYISCLAISFLLAVPLFLLVEAPLAEAVKVALLSAPAPAPAPAPASAAPAKETIEARL